MPFDLDELVAFCEEEIRNFAADHEDEDFYAFVISGGWLCLNSEQEFARTLKKFQEVWDHRLRPVARWEDLTEDDLRNADFHLGLSELTGGLDRSDRVACLAAINAYRTRIREEGSPYRNPERIRKLRENTGDWAYEGFADMTELAGFDEDAYEKHWYMSDEEQKTSEYGLAMDALLQRLRTSGIFDCLKTVPGFHATRVEHNY
jgi:hypothetical protein